MSTDIQKPKKKRGRKPKGGKIVNKELIISQNTNYKPSIILHLKCSSESIKGEAMIYDPNINSIKPSNEFDTNYNNVGDMNKIVFNAEEYNKNAHNDTHTECGQHESILSVNSNKSIHNISLNDYKTIINNINNKFSSKNNIINSHCFWCNHGFDTPAVHIPKNFINDKYNVYGYFCSIECAAGFLFNEKINMSEKFERYTLLNFLYKEVTNDIVIIPAPSPYYLLDKFCGNMSIDEYRNIYTTNHNINCINKPNSLNVEYPEIYLQMNTDSSVYNYDAISGGSFKIKKASAKNKSSVDAYFKV